MAAVARIGDSVATGHGCDGTTTLTSPTGDIAKVYADGKGIECLGNPTVVHTIPSGPACVPHTEVINSASGSVFIKGIAVARVGDGCDAGSITSGSSTVFVGD